MTANLEPCPAMKDSGVKWPGDVPEHWEVRRINVEFECLNRHRVPLGSTGRGTMTHRRNDYCCASGIIDKVDGYLFDEELLLIAEDGANLVLRNLLLAIIARGRFWVINHAHILRPRWGNREFLPAVLEGLGYLPWFPGAACKQTAPLNSTATRAHREITLLHKYRTRLIVGVVTGKLDERHLGPMTEAGTMERRYPESPTHARQAYRSTQDSLFREEQS